ncbi:hypothetical protein SK128_012019 [Halocaridina rubra]|uniref:Uncharacterized protein n=1 Tax=Halocaridina rubra TaxID=373956 RepID=A0AAN8WVP3_HALRR
MTYTLRYGTGIFIQFIIYIAGNLSQANVIGRAWRFAVLGDPTVSAFMCRDSDSLIIDREVAAVNQWLSSEESFHVIRDHIYHPEIMLAGLWGGRNKDLNMTRKMLDEMFALPPRYHRTYDQEILARLVWPRIKNDVMQHDSYHCLKQGHGEGKTAFPTQRVNGTFCGFFAYKRKDMVKLTKPCPEACRPKEHKDWTLC